MRTTAMRIDVERSRRRPDLVLSGLLLMLFSGCGLFGDEPPLVSTAGVPTTLEEVRALEKPPQTVVRVEQITQRAGGSGGCGHPVCLIIVPFLLYDALFPTQFDVATVSEGGVDTYSGMFKTDGTFIQARVHEGNEVRIVRRLDLKELDKYVIVEVSRARIGPDGKEGEQVPTSLTSQVDLVAAYREALARHAPDDGAFLRRLQHEVLLSKRHAGPRGKLMIEALTWLGEEAVPLVVENLSTKEELDATKAAVLEFVAGQRGEVSGKVPYVDEILEAVAVSPGPETADVALGVLIARKPFERKKARPFVAAQVDAVCTETANPAKRLGHLEDPQIVAMAGPMVEACAVPGTRVLMKAAMGYSLSRKEIDEAFAASDEASLQLHQYLKPDDPLQRAALFGALEAGKGLDSGIVVRLYESKRVPDSAELEVLAKSYPVKSDLVNTRIGHRAYTLALFARARAGKQKTAGAVKILKKSLAAADEKNQPYVQLVLAVLGEKGDLSRVTSLLGLADYSLAVVNEPNRVTNNQQLAAFGLSLAGWTNEQIEAAHQANTPKPQASSL